MITPEQRTELRRLANSHAAGMYKGNDIIGLLNALELAEERFEERKHEAEELLAEYAKLDSDATSLRERLEMATGALATVVSAALDSPAHDRAFCREALDTIGRLADQEVTNAE